MAQKRALRVDPEAPEKPAGASEIALPRSFGYLLRRLQLLYKKNFTRVANNDFPTGQVGILLLIGQHPGIMPSQISATLGMEPAQVAVLVNKLELQRLIRRAASTSDGRVRPLRLTAKGERQYAATVAMAQEAEDSFLEGALNEKEMKQLRALLEKLLAKQLQGQAEMRERDAAQLQKRKAPKA